MEPLIEEPIKNEPVNGSKSPIIFGVLIILIIAGIGGYYGADYLWNKAYEKGVLSVNPSTVNGSIAINSTIAYNQGKTDALSQINLARADAYCIAERGIYNVSQIVNATGNQYGIYSTKFLLPECFGGRLP